LDKIFPESSGVASEGPSTSTPVKGAPEETVDEVVTIRRSVHTNQFNSDFEFKETISTTTTSTYADVESLGTDLPKMSEVEVSDDESDDVPVEE